jgi:hypothetical protein
MTKAHAFKLNRTHLALAIVILFATFVVASSIVHHATGMHMAEWLQNSMGFYWPYANWIAGVTVGLLEAGSFVLLDTTFPFLAPFLDYFLEILDADGGPFLETW